MNPIIAGNSSANRDFPIPISCEIEIARTSMYIAYTISIRKQSSTNIPRIGSIATNPESNATITVMGRFIEKRKDFLLINCAFFKASFKKPFFF